MADLIRRVGRRVAWAGAAVAMLALSGCWCQIGAGPGHTGFNAVEDQLTAANVGTLHEAWAVAVTGGLSEPMVSEGRVFVTRNANNTSGGVQGFDAATGATLWNQQLATVPPVSGAIGFATTVTLIDDTLRSGLLEFVPQTRTGPACVAQQVSLDPVTGTKNPGPTGFPAATVDDGPVTARLVGNFTPACQLVPGAQLAVDVDGGSPAHWEATIAGGLQSEGTVTIAGGRLFVIDGTTVDAFPAAGCGAATCAPTWTRDLAAGASTPVAEASGSLFVLSGSELVALDPTTGADAWRATLPLGDGAFGTGIAIADGTVYVTAVDAADTTGTLLALPAAGCGAATCTPAWTAPLGGPGRAPVVAGGVVYSSTPTAVVAVAAAGCGGTACDPLVTVSQPAAGRLAVSDGRVFVAEPDRLVALAPA